MAKKFIFDDEDQIEVQEEIINDVPENNEPESYDSMPDNGEIIDEVHTDEFNETKEPVKESFIKRLLHMKWRWWTYLLFGLLVLILLFAGYIYAVTNTDGPVYGNRCEGVISIPVDASSSVIAEMQKEYEEIEKLDIEIVCKQIKFDITFKEGTKTKTATKIAEAVLHAFDDEVGQTKEEGKEFSNLFGHIDNEPQYEINLCMICEGNEDFPAYGTKHVQKDSVSYTYASIKDQESYDKAVSTLEEDEEE